MNLPAIRRAPPPPARFRFARPRALTAAADSGNPGQNAGRRPLTRLHQGWQLEALKRYDSVGECWYPAQFYARGLAKTRFFPAVLNDKGEREEATSGPLVELWERIRDAGGGSRNQLAASYGRLQFLNGDGYLIVSQDDDGEAWEYLSVAELRVDPQINPKSPQSYRRLRGPGLPAEVLSEAADNQFAPITGSDVRVFRLWRPHPSHTQLADAPMRAVLDLYELLHRLTLAAGAEASSRAANRGLLVVAEEIAQTMGIVQGPQDDPQEHPLLRALIEGLVSAIENPGSAEAMAPFVLMGPAAVPTAAGPVAIKDLVAWMPMGPTDRYHEAEMWDKTIERIGNGLDMPREMVTSTAGVNHWGGWLLDEQGYRLHVAPVTENFCSDLAAAYLRPAAKAASFADWEHVVVGYDPAEAILHPDQIQSAKDAHAALVVSDAYYRDKIGAKETDAPEPDELERRIMILLKEDPRLGQPAAEPGTGETPPQDGGTGGDTTEAPPSQPSEPPASGNGKPPAAVTAAALQQAKIVGAAELQVERARELAGNRLFNRAQACDECRDRLDPRPAAGLVASALGRNMVIDVINGHTSEAALVAGPGAALANKLRAWGIEGDWPDQLGRLVEQHALNTLYEEIPPQLPASFSVAVAKALR